MDGWKTECNTAAGAADTCRPTDVRFACHDCRAAHCGPCSEHLRRACRHCGRQLVAL